MKVPSVVILLFLGVWSAVGQPAMDTVSTRLVGPGCLLKKLAAPSVPMTAYVLRIDLTNPFLVLETVKGQDLLVGTERTSSMAARVNASDHAVVGAVNGDFYTTTPPSVGLPLSVQVRRGEILRDPSVHAVLGFDTSNAAMMNIVTFTGSVLHTPASGTIDGVNRTRATDQLILYNSFFGATTGTDGNGAEASIHPLKPWLVSAPVDCLVQSVSDGTGNSSLGPGEAVLSGNGRARDFINSHLHQGDTVTVNLTLTPALSNIKEMVGGWPKIVQNGADYVDQGYTDEGGPPGSGSNTQPNPRTAAGLSTDGKTLFLVAVDGRQPSLSIGMTVHELAGFLVGLGVSQGINLDGGGSTTMVIEGSVVNSPSDGSERAVGNSLAIVSKNIPEAWVCPTGDCGHPGYGFGRIQTAVNYVAPGGTLHVATGTYDETVTLSRNLLLTSPGVPTIRDLEVNGGNITLESSVQISGTLRMTAGTLRTGSNKVVVTSNEPAAVVITSGTVNGEVQRTIAAGSSDTYSFTELHTSIAPDGSQPAMNFSVRSYPGTYPPGAPSSGAVNRYYVLTSVGAALTATLSLAYDHAELNGIPEKNLVLFSASDGAPWVERGGTVNSADNDVQLNTVSDWSTWTMGEADNPLPIQLVSFGGVVMQGVGIRLSWETLSEVNCYGFELQKSRNHAHGYATIAGSFVSGHGTTTTPWKYSSVDSTTATGMWFYRLVQIDLDGMRRHSDGIRVDILTDVPGQAIPDTYSMSQNYPNPFNPTTVISYQLPVTSDVNLAVYDLLGREVAVLMDGQLPRGYHTATFDGTQCAGGTYICRLRVQPVTGTHTGVVMKSRTILLLR